MEAKPLQPPRLSLSQMDAQEVGVRDQEVHVGAHPTRENLERVAAAVDRLGHLVAEIAAARLLDLGVELGLAGDRAVERLQGDARLGGDLLHGGFVEAVAGKHVLGRLEDEVAVHALARLLEPRSPHRLRGQLQLLPISCALCSQKTLRSSSVWIQPRTRRRSESAARSSAGAASVSGQKIKAI
jgi:hypothetical protein